MPQIMISVGEASGDLHGASVANALKLIKPDIELFGMGGEAMRNAGVEIVYDIKDLGVIGLVEVVKNLPRLFKLRAMLARILDERRPDALVIIDYPGFNVRLAKIAQQKGIPVISYIAPSAWAWGKGRAREVAQIVERVASILPFEADVYREAGANVTFVGHPLLDIVQPAMSKEDAYRHFGADPGRPVVLLMPGSRQQEIDGLLPPMLGAAEKIREAIPDCQFFLPVASTISREMLQKLIDSYTIPVAICSGNTYDLMNIASVAIVSSGTATLETALMELPTVIIYKVAVLTGFIGRFLLKIPHVGLPNIIAGRKIVPELLQGDVNPEAISRETLQILNDRATHRQMLSDLAEVRRKLGETGAVERVARVILEVVEKHRGGSR